MAKKVTSETVAENLVGKLRKLIVSNFRCIGSTPVEIDLDDIVVLVGGNNVGKSTIMRAYETVMEHKSLTLDDFPNHQPNEINFPIIEVHTVVSSDRPAQKWIATDPVTNEDVVRERWMWKSPGAPTREGFDVEKNDWDASVPWGAPNIAKSRRPKPFRVDAFAQPDEQAKQICDILLKILRDRVKSDDGSAKIQNLYEKIGEYQKEIVEDSKHQIEAIESLLSEELQKIFPGYEVNFDARPEDDLNKLLSTFKAESRLLMGPKGGTPIPISDQGSGARRTLLWTALKVQADIAAGRANPQEQATGRSGLLLLDEPEICLHPSAIRDACKLLYDLSASDSWQVMTTTHCPVFIDLTRDNTTVVRVDRNAHGAIQGTTLFRPSAVALSGDDKENVKLLNMFDPYVAEFFFGGRVLIVEGDTEYTAFKYVASNSEDKAQYQSLHIIRARGKDTIVSLCKILNQFGAPYSVLHDSDSPTVTRKNGSVVANGKWTTNQNIRTAIESSAHKEAVRHLVSLTTFERAYFGTDVTMDKPYRALEAIKDPQSDAFRKCEKLLRALLFNEQPPFGCVEWENLEQLSKAYDAFLTAEVSAFTPALSEATEAVISSQEKKIVEDGKSG